MSANQVALAELELKGKGQGVPILLTDTTQITGSFTRIQVMADAIFNTLTSNIKKNGVSTNAVAADFGTLTKGTVIEGKFTVVKLTSGSVLVSS